MKNSIFASLTFMSMLSVLTLVAQPDLRGAWETEKEGNRITWINSEKFFAATVYNLEDKKFVGTCGGSWKLEGNTFKEVHEFNTMNPEWIGKELVSEVTFKEGKLFIKTDSGTEVWTRVDSGTPGKLAGAWLITGRVTDGKQNTIIPGARKTMKILSGSRFQWIAYNNETKEFLGTGGGTYTTENGKYTESIQFFSRDSSRVGMSLQFDFALEDGNWRHKGFSSKGDPIDEVWTKREKLGL